jgi:hypothetical protein
LSDAGTILTFHHRVAHLYRPAWRRSINPSSVPILPLQIIKQTMSNSTVSHFWPTLLNALDALVRPASTYIRTEIVI